MLKIKLSPLGKKHARHYRIVIAEEHSKVTGRCLAIVGDFHPQQKQLTIDQDLVAKWIQNGAQPTPAVRQLLSQKTAS